MTTKPLSGVTIRNIRSQASCGCGWKGPWRWRRRVARADLDKHDADHLMAAWAVRDA